MLRFIFLSILPMALCGVAKPSADCPRQYGYFRSPLAHEDCAKYRMCVGGQAFELSCPPGLAFNLNAGHCDWPENVPSCNLPEFLGFTCPVSGLDSNGKSLDTLVNHKYVGNCDYYFSCEKGRARLLPCDEGMAFDPASGRCVNKSLVKCDHQNSKLLYV